MVWELIEDVRYPDYDSYEGQATQFDTEWNSILDLVFDTHEFVMNLLSNITTTYNDVKPIQLLLHRQYEVWYGIPYWHYKMKLYAHDSPIAPAIITAILGIIEIAIIAIAAFIILTSAKEIIWGPEGSPPILPIAILLAVVLVGGSYFIKAYKEVKRK